MEFIENQKAISELYESVTDEARILYSRFVIAVLYRRFAAFKFNVKI